MFQGSPRLVTYFSLTLFSLVFACKTHIARTNPLEQTAIEELGSDFTVNFNESKTFALCQQTRINDHMNSEFKYCVINASENRVAHKGSYQQGYVKWIDDKSIEVASTNKFSTELTKRVIQIIQEHQ